jgi:hypothetical protein
MKKFVLIGFFSTVLAGGIAMAQTDDGEKKTVGWFNTTELSLAVTEGNSATKNFAFKNSLTRRWEKSRVKLVLDGLRADTTDDRFFLTDTGQTFLPGETNPPLTFSTVVTPEQEVDAEKYFVEGRFTKELSGSRNWNAGGSWDRNEDAGILNRSIVFGGIGNRWKDGEKLDLETSYGLSFTNREEETPDPEKEQEFAGIRLTMDLDYRVLPSTTLSYDLTGNLNVEDRSDYSADTTGSLSVTMSKRLSLKFSTQLLYNSEPALEDLDVIAWLSLIDPDLTPGNGDEFFQTVPPDSPDAFEIVFGEDRARKTELDTVFRTSLVINF